ncbi:transcription repressor OFP14-like [Cannabis sativa]|uniref:transcription repressor OFP14-like n=1 Tax=Cannabis sativa TaxID=3483 RepID=UPI0029C9B4F5|nr:transcription repressor OFP14-like [Cannabis sativa]
MDATQEKEEEEEEDDEKAREMSMTLRTRSMTKRRTQNNKKESFSARLPDDVSGVFSESTCVVKLSTNTSLDIRESILEKMMMMMKKNEEFGSEFDWNDLEELIYCYIALNSPDIHTIIINAFLDLKHFLINE